MGVGGELLRMNGDGRCSRLLGKSFENVLAVVDGLFDLSQAVVQCRDR